MVTISTPGMPETMRSERLSFRAIIASPAPGVRYATSIRPLLDIAMCSIRDDRVNWG